MPHTYIKMGPESFGHSYCCASSMAEARPDPSIGVHASRTITLRQDEARYYGVNSRDVVTCLNVSILRVVFFLFPPSMQVMIRVALFVSPLALLLNAEIPQSKIKECSDTVAPYPAVPR